MYTVIQGDGEELFRISKNDPSIIVTMFSEEAEDRISVKRRVDEYLLSYIVRGIYDIILITNNNRPASVFVLLNKKN